MSKIIITGTSRGIGFELVNQLAAAGHQILALSRNENPILELGLPGVTTWSFDITDTEHIKKAAAWVKLNWAAADVLIHNAGVLLNRPFTESTVDDFRAVYEVNVFGVAELTRALIPVMKAEGHVLTISSMGGVQGSAKFPGLAAYSSSKGAVITLVELLAEEYKDTGPSFNVLALGAVQTEMLEAAFPGYQAPVGAGEMASYIGHFALTGHAFYNGKILPVSNSTP